MQAPFFSTPPTADLFDERCRTAFGIEDKVTPGFATFKLEAAREQAGREWELSPQIRQTFSTKNRFVAIRTQELMGKFRQT